MRPLLILIVLVLVLVAGVVVAVNAGMVFQPVVQPDPNCTPVPYQGDCPNL